MKLTFLLVILAIAGAATREARADEPANNLKSPKTTASVQTKKARAAKRHQERERLVTGSYIKQEIRQDGLITDSSQPLYIIDRKTIQNSGALTVSQVLRRTGVGR